MAKVYVASSWRNKAQPEVVDLLRRIGYEVYDFRNPPDSAGFGWEEINANWQQWSPNQFRSALGHERAEEGFASDFDALKAADIVVMVQPCGRSAALELGYAVGAGKRTFVLMAPGEPELMLKMADRLCLTLTELVQALASSQVPA